MDKRMEIKYQRITQLLHGFMDDKKKCNQSTDIEKSGLLLNVKQIFDDKSDIQPNPPPLPGS